MNGKRKVKWTLFLSLMLVLSMFLAACSSGSKDTSGSAGGSGKEELAKDQVLNLMEPVDIPSLNWTQITDTTSSTTIGMVTSGLMRFDQNMEPKPDMADGMPKISKDKKVYTFKIRKDAKWSDGSPVTANDFVFAWRKMVDPKTASQYAFIFASANIKNAAKIDDKKSPLFGKVDQLGVKALDDHTLQVTLEKPTPYLLSTLCSASFIPQKKEFVEKEGNNLGQEPKDLLSNGPYILTKWNHGSGWSFKKNENYWNAKNIHIEKVNVSVLKQKSTAVNLYNTGKLDSTLIDSEFVDQFKGKPDYHSTLMAAPYFIRLNQAKVPALKNEKVRKAIYGSIDRDTMAKDLIKDGSVGAKYIVPKGFAKGPDHKDFRSTSPNGFNAADKQQAKKLWEQAKTDLGIKSLKLDLMTQDQDKSVKIAEYVANQIEKNLPGVSVNVLKQPWGQYLKLESAGHYQMSISGWSPDYLDPMTFLDMWTTGNPMNRMGYSDKKYDQLIDEANNLGAEPQKRWEKMQEAEKLLLDKDTAVIPLYQRANAYVTKPYVKGLIYPSFGFDLDWTHAKVLKH
ncbi:oligopeptide transport system substrate-binding protein [Scopulibacillus daqui]|uniref:Oligopeptide transport system substrate-binding protein n=1 Tax=Scopulibacillus daqui TaxID=1469162 RepID=A0ABS2PWE0_9BACL|nr:peptide ABC transporter substrate-binding protein [Scopulibacillus daqui]MBM7644020.1 oligopeptide transport system substrate-binding protein [Scopulibacillus daqui]